MNMAEEKKQEKKIIIDEDWKTQARREKEQLKAKTKVEKEEKQQKQPDSQPLPEAEFGTMVSMLATQAMFAMGFIRTEKDKEPTVDLNMAKFNIDLLGVLEEKTKGNLSDDEQKMLTDTLAQLRMGYIKAAG
ncbi:MAG: DUF1844 domain-containing protein [Planctomycetes bacterium]|nr:DUF1844 domain-containing protein [Planctomycetota bacterium]